ncbi:MAG: hypothetical protein IM552_03055, partial [Chitinophagaceae bacterium]|nr:hypothetical protein [Chitinophagaceae bacterium]
TSSPIRGTTGVFAIQTESAGARPSMQDTESFKQSLMQLLRSSSFRSQDALRKAAKIKDNRFQFN